MALGGTAIASGRAEPEHTHRTNAEYEQEECKQGTVVQAKYRGTTADQREMHALGRVQELQRNFKFVSVLGFGCTLIGTWEFFLGLIAFGLTDGGTAGLIYGFLVVLAGFMCVYLSIAEMASMAPTSGGQYHWVSQFAPPSAQKYLSYISAGTIIQGLIVLNDSSYSPQPYQGMLLVWAVTVFCILFNVFLARRLPFVEGVLLIIYIVGFFVIIIPLWVLAPRADARTVFTTFNNAGGWNSKVHMAEEIKDSSKTLPEAIVYGVIVNGVMGLVMVITMCFTLGDPESILSTATGYPFIQVFFNATKSYAATNVMTAIIIIVFTSAVISEIATSSRQLWSFARDGGFPCSAFIAKISRSQSIPLNAILVSLAIVMLISLINLGSAVALNAINSLTISALMSSYILTISCVLYKRLRKEPLPARRWTLGRYGMAVNIGAMVFLLPMFVFAFFPLATPVSPASMNWGSVMFFGIVGLATLYYYLWGHKYYTPPVLIMQTRDSYEM
ncbi:hypothetical protein LTR36_010986 [Oleoguttula mirabilis]|uniref:Amino acid transporter n=1 Tax=Oleoguttula mirabilis TaxID=1507867 RepID=A0AAV9J451_9PEZI|nr:hypothetical protein LTR36_010986 [Oleoguttula mirabilis]